MDIIGRDWNETINEIWYIADNKLKEKLPERSEQIKLINMSGCVIVARLDTSSTAFYNYLIILNYNKFIREIIHYGAD